MKYLSGIGRFFRAVAQPVQRGWQVFRALRRPYQIGIGLVLIALVGGGVMFLNQNTPAASDNSLRTVSLASVASLGGAGSASTVLGTVHSISEANILAQAGGTVQAIHTSIGAMVPAGFVIAELENASEQAAVLQAQGTYDAAVAARAAASPQEVGTAARNTYQSAFTTLDTTLSSDVDVFFGAQTALGPAFLVNPAPFELDYFSRKRAALTIAMNTWQSHLATADSQDPLTLLDEADTVTRQAQSLLIDLATVTNTSSTDANTTQRADLATARAAVNTLLATISTERTTYRSGTNSTTAGADASVKTALGALRGAQANLERTIVRAPISGTVNFLSLHVGDYVTALSHVATVAQNGALEVVVYVPAEDRNLLSVGQKVSVEDTSQGVVTSIAPALDPVTKQVEVHVAVTSGSFVNGQSVRIALPDTTPTKTTASTSLTLPLTAVKLLADTRVVFSVGTDGRLVAHQVDIGEVHGDRIEIKTQLPADLQIVIDARGLSEGEKVNSAPSP